MVPEYENDIPQVGRVEWIGLSSAPREAVHTPSEVEALEGHGLTGDHHATRKPGGKRQVTLIQSEHLSVIADLSGRDGVAPELLRRNLVVSGINLIALKGARFRIGDVLLEGTGPCAPCSRMEEALGEGGYQAMRGHGGITASVLSTGQIRIGDPVRFESGTGE